MKKVRWIGSFREMTSQLRTLLANWFSVGFLTIEQVTWSSPCSMLQKVSDYEVSQIEWTMYSSQPVQEFRSLAKNESLVQRCCWIKKLTIFKGFSKLVFGRRWNARTYMLYGNTKVLCTKPITQETFHAQNCQDSVMGIYLLINPDYKDSFSIDVLVYVIELSNCVNDQYQLNLSTDFLLKSEILVMSKMPN